MGNIVAHGRGDGRNVWVLIGGEIAEVTPLDDSHAAAVTLTRGLGQRFYFKRVPDALTREVMWTAVDIESRPSDGMKAFPTQDAAVMYVLARISMQAG